MFWKKNKTSKETAPKAETPKNNDAVPPPPQSKGPSPIDNAKTSPTGSMMGPVLAIGKWTHRAQTARQSMLATKPKIAFMPDMGITYEMLELEEHLEHAHHRVSFEHHKRRESQAVGTPLAAAPATTASTSVAQQKPQQQPQAQQKPQGGGDAGKKNVEFTFNSRPFRAHMVDIEKRRMRKFIDIMNSPDEVYPPSEKDLRVPFSPQGTLIFHILELSKLAINDASTPSSLPVSFYCVLSIGPLKRTSKIVHSSTSKRIRVDYTAHFSIEIPEWRESPLNRFVVELWSYQDPEMHYIIGMTEIHTYEFIRKQHSVEEFKLWSDGINVGKMYCEYSFSYGYFGYGHSNYLKNPKNPIMETACHSVYPRIKIEPGDLVDKVYRVRMPEQLKVFTFNSLILDVSEAVDTDATRLRKRRLENTPTKPIIVEQVSFEEDKPVHCKLHMNIYQKEIQPDFNDTYGEFICLQTRKTRLDYLSSLVQGRMRDLYEDEAGVLFRPLKDKEADKIQKSEINHPGYLVHPTRLPCTTSLGTPQLTKEDEEFQDSFPSLRRGQGYLAMLFGFQKRPEPSEFLNDMDDPLYKSASVGARRFGCFRWLRRLFLCILAYCNLVFNFVFPEVRKPPPVPEISVTTPTPPGSTTKVFTYFAKDSKDLGSSKLSKLQAQTEVLIQLAERPTADVGASDTASSSSEEEPMQLTKAEMLKRGQRDIKKSFAPPFSQANKPTTAGSNSTIMTDSTAPPPNPLLVKMNFPPIAPDFTGPGGHFKRGINQPLL